MIGDNTYMSNSRYWADQMAEEIIASGQYKPYWVDDMKTPSGRVHIGSIRTLLTHYLVYQALVDAGQEATFSYVFETQDPFDKVPHYLDAEQWKEHLGKPLGKVPSPEPGFESYGHRWAQEYIDIFSSLGVHPQIIWGAELYSSGKMNDMIRLCLDSADTISGIYKELYDEPKPENWYPFNVECEQCGKIDTTSVTDWDGSEVTYTCHVEGSYAPGCGHSGRRSPFDGGGKMPWKVEWPCKWQVIGVTVEGAGKDHMSEGGSHDFAKLMCERVLKFQVPYAVSHEFFLTGGRKMSSSKGVGSSAKEISEIIPPFLIRFAIARVKYNRAINFDPNGDTIPDLYDAFDEAARAYWDQSDDKLARIFELSQVDSEPPKDSFFLPRFRDIVRVLQDPKLDLQRVFVEQKGSSLSAKELRVLQERAEYARKWLADYAPREDVVAITADVPAEAQRLSDEQRSYLQEVIHMLGEAWESPEVLQQALYQKSKDMGLGARDAFQAIYLSLLGRTHGPKAAWFLQENLDKALHRFREIVEA